MKAVYVDAIIKLWKSFRNDAYALGMVMFPFQEHISEGRSSDCGAHIISVTSTKRPFSCVEESFGAVLSGGL